MASRGGGYYIVFVRVEVAFPLIGDDFCDDSNRLSVSSPRIITTGFCQEAGVTGDVCFYRRRDSLWGGSRQFFFSALLFACLFEFNEYFQNNNDFLRFLPSFSRVLYSPRVVQMTGQSPTLSLNSTRHVELKQSVGGKSEHHRTAGWLTARRSDPTEECNREQTALSAFCAGRW